jgi:uncharacterized membrane protein
LDAGRRQTPERNLNDMGEVEAAGADSQVKTVESLQPAIRCRVIPGRLRVVTGTKRDDRMPGLRTLVISYLAALAAFCGLDFVWLSFAGETIYRPAIGELLRSGFDAPAAVAFYLIYVFGLVFLAIRPAARLTEAMSRGAVYGFCAYATYDLTNQATLRHWPLTLSLVDMAWGTALSAVAAACGYFASAMALRTTVAGAAGAAKTR